jgi:hypothetical protein
MSDTVLLWVLGGQLAMIVGLFKLWWDHVKECRARAANDAVMRSDIDRLLKEVGDREHGMRAAMHKLREDLSPFAVYVQLEMQRRGKER